MAVPALAERMSLATPPAVARRSWRPRLALLLVSALLLTGCSGEESSPKLDALKADPMASFELPNMTVDSVSEKVEGESMGKLHGARYSRYVHITSGSPKSVIKAVKELAEANGWKTTANRPRYYAAQKTLDEVGPTIPADLTVTFSDSRSAAVILDQE